MAISPVSNEWDILSKYVTPQEIKQYKSKWEDRLSHNPAYMWWVTSSNLLPQFLLCQLELGFFSLCNLKNSEVPQISFQNSYTSISAYTPISNWWASQYHVQLWHPCSYPALHSNNLASPHEQMCHRGSGGIQYHMLMDSGGVSPRIPWKTFF